MEIWRGLTTTTTTTITFSLWNSPDGENRTVPTAGPKELSEVVPVEENGVKLCTSSESIKLCSYCKKTKSSLRIEGGVRNSRDMVAIQILFPRAG